MRGQAGFTYVAALLTVAVLSIVSLRAVEVTGTRLKREAEAELLLVGQEYARAIQSYYVGAPGTQRQYPKRLQDLLEDNRTNRTFRHLRKLYFDPIESSQQWGIVEAPDGGIMGVYSKSTKSPAKRAGFAVGFESFSSARTYQDWKFVYEAKDES